MAWQAVAQLAALTLISVLVAGPVSGSADAVYVNGNIYTLDPAHPRAEALAVAGDHLVAVGSNAEVQRLAQPDAKTFDLHGQTVLPGLIDAHCHMAGLGSFGLGRLDRAAAGRLACGRADDP